jgi:hypothetical protein
MGQISTKLNKKCLKSKLRKGKVKNISRKKKNKDFKVPDLEESEKNHDEIVSGCDSEAKKRMQDQLAFNSDIFVLDQMMMSVQFFGNFER